MWGFQDSHNRVLQTKRLKTAEIYCLTVLEVTSLKSRCWESCLPLGPWVESSLSSSAIWGWPAILRVLGLWLHPSNFCSILPWPSHCIFTSSPLLVCLRPNSSFGQGHPSFHYTRPCVLKSENTPVPNQVTSQGTGS